MTKANKTMTLVPLGRANARWPLLVTTAPPTEERKLPNAAWTAVTRRDNTAHPRPLLQHQLSSQGDKSSSVTTALTNLLRPPLLRRLRRA